MNSLLGMSVRVSDLAMTIEPVKRHLKKRWMSDGYHARIQKKWSKRFGMKRVPGALRMGDTLILHPVIYERLKAELIEQEIERVEPKAEITPRGVFPARDMSTFYGHTICRPNPLFGWVGV